jgi:hypothetical protein
MGRKVSSKILQEYKDPDEYCWLNLNDEVLHPIRIDMPQPKQIEKIQGYGVEAVNQTFQYEQYPSRLAHIERDVRKQIRRIKRLTVTQQELLFHERIWDVLFNNYDRYKDEIEWIKWQWYYRLYGKWYFINGKPTYINGWNWFYLNYWHLEGEGLPEYRDRDRRWFHGQWYAYTTQERPKISKTGDLMHNPDGSVIMEDAGVRTIFGTNNVKPRRVGDTSKAVSILYNISNLQIEAYCGIQGDSEDTSQSVFRRKLVLAFRQLPFFFKPTFIDPIPSTILEFDSKEHGFGIRSKIDYASSVYRSFYDGEKLHGLHLDEAGSLDKRENVNGRHRTLLRCLYQGTRVIGFMIYTSTVKNMTPESGEEFMKLAEGSHFEQRNSIGRTQTGLINIMFKAYDGLEGFIGPYGESVIESPTPQQIEFMGNKAKNRDGEYVGAREYIEADRADHRKRNDMEALTDAKRLFPNSYKEAFTPPARNTFFNMEIIEKRIGELQFDNEKTIRGNFEWVAGFGSDVKFIEKPEVGRFVIAKRLQEHECNKKIKKGNNWHPQGGHKYVASGDAFRLEKGESSRVSDGGGAVLRVYNESIDPPNKSLQDWQTNNFVCAYRSRPPTPEEYVEDMLKMCIYYGAKMYPENNIDEIEKQFKKWGYKGYLLYDIDPKTGKKKNNAGFFSGGTSKQSLFNRGIEFIDHHGARCDIIEILKEFGAIRGLDDMTNYDLLTSVFGCLRAQEEILRRVSRKGQVTAVDVGGVFRQRYY